MWFKDLDDTYQDVLDRARVAKLLKLLHDDHGEATPPSAAEVDWVMRKNALSSPDSMTLQECETVVHTYKSYLKRRPEIERAFSEYDADGDDFLNRAELSRYVACELNGGDAPDDEALDWLVKRVDVGGAFSDANDVMIGRTEIMRAKDEWCLMPDSVGSGASFARRNRAPASDARLVESDDEREPKKGCACVVM